MSWTFLGYIGNGTRTNPAHQPHATYPLAYLLEIQRSLRRVFT